MFTATRDAEAKLVETVGSVKEECNSWRGMHFRFSRLLEHYRSDYQVKIAVNLINDLLKANQGGIFVCVDSDIFVVVRNVTKNVLDKVIFQLRYLFMDDPLAYSSENQENPEFCRLHDLSVDYVNFLELCKAKLASSSRANAQGPSAVAQRSSAPAAVNPQESTPVSSDGKLKLFTPSRLVAIERDLTNADVSKVLRRQPVCAAVPNMMIRRVFDEVYINIAHLRQMLKSDSDFLSNRWLFKYLTTILDLRMLDMLARNSGRFFDAPVSLNLNVETLLSNRFMEFDAAIKPSVKVSIVIEIQVADVYNDMSAFLIAKDTVQKLGYRVCLDGLTSLSITQIDRERLGFDLAKLQWNADMESDIKSKENKMVADAIQACGPNRIILCRCDNKQAVDYGQALGVSLFQGRFLDKVINPTAKVEN
jgi:hypothetical protein